MNLMACRPMAWAEIVGQDRAVSLLRCLLTVGRFLPRGFIFCGPWGVGKTSVAYIMSRALMCSGDNPMGCRKCHSCLSVDKDGIEHCPDFYESDAASKPGVDDARHLMECMAQPPVLGRRRVTILDEAHRLSKEAWDVFLKPLEKPDTNSVFIFVSTEESKIPSMVKSRCLTIPFSRVATDALTGLLANLCSRHGIEYELPALAYIAKHSKGIVRDAVGALDLAASFGKVNGESASLALDDPLEALCTKCLLAVAAGDREGSVKYIDEAGQRARAARVVETLFSTYARCLWDGRDEGSAAIAASLSDIREVSAIFIRWSGAKFLPSDALPLLAYELLGACKVRRPETRLPRSVPQGVTKDMAI